MINKRDGSSSTGETRFMFNEPSETADRSPLRTHSRAKSTVPLCSCWRHRNPFRTWLRPREPAIGFSLPPASITTLSASIPFQRQIRPPSFPSSFLASRLNFYLFVVIGKGKFGRLIVLLLDIAFDIVAVGFYPSLHGVSERSPFRIDGW